MNATVELFNEVNTKIRRLEAEVRASGIDIQSLALLENAKDLIRFVRNDYYNKVIEIEYSRNQLDVYNS